MKAELKVGAPGSYVVSVDGEVVAQKKMFGFPSEDEVVAAVRSKLQR